VPLPTIDAINSHPFYTDLFGLQQLAPPRCPWAVPTKLWRSGCVEPHGVYPYQPVTFTQAQLAAAARDAARMHIGWAVVWKRNNSVTDFILPFLRETGFRFAYRSCGQHSVLVYQRSPKPAFTSGKCLR
jgi:hypothetical protein